MIHERRLGIKADVAYACDELEVVNTITLPLVKMFKEDNPKFNEFFFIEAANKDMA